MVVCPVLLIRTVAVCASAGADQRSAPPSASRAKLTACRNEAGRAEGTEPGPAWSWSARGIHARGASPASSSGSDARRRDAIMTYPRLARPQNPGGGGGHLCYVAARDRRRCERRSDARGRRSVRRLRCMDRSVERYVTHISHINPAGLTVISNRTTRCSRIAERSGYHEC